jgi:hypothetical protein
MPAGVKIGPRSLTFSWRTVYSDGVKVIDDLPRDERIGYDICGDELQRMIERQCALHTGVCLSVQSRHDTEGSRCSPV